MAIRGMYWAECDGCERTYPHLWEEGSDNPEIARQKAVDEAGWKRYILDRLTGGGKIFCSYCKKSDILFGDVGRRK